MTGRRPTYPRPGALAGAALLGALATHRPDETLAAVLATQPPITWAETLGDAVTLTPSGALVRLAVNLGASVRVAGTAVIHPGGEFDRACQLAGLPAAPPMSPQVGWVLTVGGPGHAALGFNAGAHGAVAAIAATCVLSAATRKSHQRPETPVRLHGPDEHPVNQTEARAAAAGMPSVWSAAAELAGVAAVLDTWTTGPGPTVEPDTLLRALHPAEPLTAGPPGPGGSPTWWLAGSRLQYWAPTEATSRWVEGPAPPDR